MATINYVSKQNLSAYDSLIKTFIENTEKTKSIKWVEVDGNTINFYKKTNPVEKDKPDFKVDFPKEYFLDQAKTTFVDNFIFSTALYPGAADPMLDGQPVMVLAVKGEILNSEGELTNSDTAKYSFVSLRNLVDIYTGGQTSSVEISVNSENTITADVMVSDKADNIVSVVLDGADENGIQYTRGIHVGAIEMTAEEIAALFVNGDTAS